LGDEIQAIFVGMLCDHLEAAKIEAAQHFGPGNQSPSPFCNGKVNFINSPDFWENTS
jgi:hypothetical protein